MSIKGKVLKVKTGYNPNSSSIGTEVTAFLWGATIFTICVNILFSIVTQVLNNKSKKKK